MATIENELIFHIYHIQMKVNIRKPYVTLLRPTRQNK